MELEEVVRHLRRLKDEMEILRLKARYFNAGDTQDFDIIGECFTEDAIIDYPPFPVFRGGDSLRDAFRRNAAQVPKINIHQGHNPDIRFLDDDTAEGTWNLCYFAYIPASETLLQSNGLYHDRYVRTASGWKISHSRAETRIAVQAVAGSGSGVNVSVPDREYTGGEARQPPPS